MRKFTVAGVVALCSLPGAALNVWPKVPQIMAGTATGSDIAFVVFVVTAVLLMAAVPFAVEKASNIGWKSLFWAFGLSLATLNYCIGVAGAGKMRDSDAGPLRELVHKHAALDSRIERATNSRKQLPQVSPAVDQACSMPPTRRSSWRTMPASGSAARLERTAGLRVAELKTATKARAPLLRQKADGRPDRRGRDGNPAA